MDRGWVDAYHAIIPPDAFFQPGMPVAGSTPGLCGSMGYGMKWSGKSCGSRESTVRCKWPAQIAGDLQVTKCDEP